MHVMRLEAPQLLLQMGRSHANAGTKHCLLRRLSLFTALPCLRRYLPHPRILSKECWQHPYPLVASQCQGSSLGRVPLAQPTRAVPRRPKICILPVPVALQTPSCSSLTSRLSQALCVADPQAVSP